MPDRKTRVQFEPNISDPYRFKIWSDLPNEDIAAIDGITSVSPERAKDGSRTVFVDHRYDPGEVREEIRRIAEKDD